MRKALFAAVAAAAMLTGCDRQRDLWVRAVSLIEIVGDWVPSLGRDDMSGNATAMLYPGGDGEPLREFFSLPDRVTARTGGGSFDILIFNGVMFSEQQTNLEQITFRNTSSARSFEAVVDRVAPSGRLTRQNDEYVAGNGMQILTSAYAKVDMDGAKGYSVKYVNGYDCFDVPGEYLEREIRLTPRPLSYYVQVVVHLINPQSAVSASGALRGFAASVFMASGMPSHQSATHQLRLNDMKIDQSTQPWTGTISSPVFVTFGPPLDIEPGDGSWPYTFELAITLRDGTAMPLRTFDVTAQVVPLVEYIKAGVPVNSREQPYLIEIWESAPNDPDKEGILLPAVGSEIGLWPWEDGETIIIRVPDDK